MCSVYIRKIALGTKIRPSLSTHLHKTVAMTPPTDSERV